jgi:hypothetical protein
MSTRELTLCRNSLYWIRTQDFLGIFQGRLAVACSLPLYKGTASSLIYRISIKPSGQVNSKGWIQRKTWCMGPYAGVEYNLTHVHSKVHRGNTTLICCNLPQQIQPQWLPSFPLPRVAGRGCVDISLLWRGVQLISAKTPCDFLYEFCTYK